MRSHSRLKVCHLFLLLAVFVMPTKKNLSDATTDSIMFVGSWVVLGGDL